MRPVLSQKCNLYHISNKCVALESLLASGNELFQKKTRNHPTQRHTHKHFPDRRSNLLNTRLKYAKLETNTHAETRELRTTGTDKNVNPMELEQNHSDILTKTLA